MSPPSRWDAAVEILLGVLFVFTPLAIGGVEPWSELVILPLVVAAVLCLACRLVLRADLPFLWSWAYLPVALFVGLACLQLAPLPAAWARLLSPQTVRTKAELVGDLPGAAAVLERVTLSFYPLATRHDLRVVLYAAAVFVVVANVYRRPVQIRRLLGTIAAVGGSAAVLSLFLVAFNGTRDITFILSDTSSVSLGLAHVHSHFSQHLNLCVGAALGLLLLLLHEASRAADWEPVAPWRLAGRLGRVDFRLAIMLVGVCVLGMLCVALSGSRGGTVSTAAAVAVTLGLLFLSGARGTGWVVGLLATAAFGCLLYFGFDALYDRFAAPGAAHVGGRTPIWWGLVGLYRQYPLLGTGLGTHAVVFPAYDPVLRAGTLVTHAENEYAQLLEETGAAGAAVAAAFVVLIGWCFVRAVRGAGDANAPAAFGLGFGLVAVMVHSLSDFGQHLPANACLSAAFCGLLVALARRRPGGAGAAAAVAPRPRSGLAGPSRWAAVAGLVGLAVGAGWQLREVDDSRRGAVEWQRAESLAQSLAAVRWEVSREDYDLLTSRAAAAARWCPQNVVYRNGLTVYRWRAFEHVREEGGDPMRRRQEQAAEVVAACHATSLLCPTFGPPHTLAGQLELFLLDRPEGAAHIRAGYELAPNDDDACLAAGKMEVRAGRPDEALVPFRRAIRLNGGRLAEVTETFLYESQRPDLAVGAAGDDPGALLQLADVLERSGEDLPPARPDLATAARAQALALLQAASDRPDAPPDQAALLASLCEGQKDYESAVRYYRRALAGRYDQGGWHVALARVLLATHQPDAAVASAKAALRVQPGCPGAAEIINQAADAGGR